MNEKSYQSKKVTQEKIFINSSKISTCSATAEITNTIFSKPIFDQIVELRYVKNYSNLSDTKISQFVNCELSREEIELDYIKKRDKIAKDGPFEKKNLSHPRTKK